MPLPSLDHGQDIPPDYLAELAKKSQDFIDQLPSELRTLSGKNPPPQPFDLSKECDEFCDIVDDLDKTVKELGISIEE
ncbi:hypothetical protein HON22_02800 [Candidatus Peregrinibacteria bacterium]|jgi:hypothetical protein|nr:hypothetical protein [Candidatus Peregrinibacteria bacterium]